jgi:hypothetical protein
MLVYNLTDNSVKDSKELQEIKILSNKYNQNLNQYKSKNSDKNIKQSTKNQSIQENSNRNYYSNRKEVICNNTN